MAITTAIANSFKTDLLKGVHNFLLSGGNDMKIALYIAATMSKSTTAYTASNEIPGTGNYNATGASLTRIDPALSGDTAVVDFADQVWSAATISADGCMIYNNTAAGKNACSVHDFGGTKTSTAGDFTVVFPTADSSNAIIRIA